MKHIKVQVASNDPEPLPAKLTIEINRGAGWSEVEQVRIFEEGKDYVYDLEPNHRILIEPYPPRAVAYDQEQSAAYVVMAQEELGKIDAPKEAAPKEIEERERKYAKDSGGELPRYLQEKDMKEKEEKRRAEEKAKDEAKEAKEKKSPFPENDEAKAKAAKSPLPAAPPPKAGTKEDPNPGLISSRDLKK